MNVKGDHVKNILDFDLFPQSYHMGPAQVLSRLFFGAYLVFDCLWFSIAFILWKKAVRTKLFAG